MDCRPVVFRAVRSFRPETFRDLPARVKFKGRSIVRRVSTSVTLLAASCLGLAAVPAAEDARDAKPGGDSPGWISLFDGQGLQGWKSSNFGGEGQVRVEDRRIVLDFGDSLTGIVWTQDFPQQDYEFRLQAMRVDGIDFFCGLTFPVGASHCSLIVGGWAGALVGLSSIDGRDASENETTQYDKFDRGTWYRIRVRVTAQRIRCWIDDRQIIDQELRGRRIGTRPEMDLSKPLGIAAWQTRAAVREIEYRRLREGER